MSVKWENPTPAPSPRRPSKYDELTRALRRHPGRWAVFSESCGNSTVTAIKSAKIPAFAPAGDFDATSKRVGDGRVKVWVRYVGTRVNRREELGRIRAWAIMRGYDVHPRGRVPQQIIDAYDAAHQEDES